MSKIEAYAEIRPLFCNSNDEMPSPESVNNEPISYMLKKVKRKEKQKEKEKRNRKRKKVKKKRQKKKKKRKKKEEKRRENEGRREKKLYLCMRVC